SSPSIAINNATCDTKHKWFPLKKRCPPRSYLDFICAYRPRNVFTLRQKRDCSTTCKL
ncbi:hypothetical protein L9F63_000030, partial [Diploptera punctata]